MLRVEGKRFSDPIGLPKEFKDDVDRAQSLDLPPSYSSPTAMANNGDATGDNGSTNGNDPRLSG